MSDINLLPQSMRKKEEKERMKKKEREVVMSSPEFPLHSSRLESAPKKSSLGEKLQYFFARKNVEEKPKIVSEGKIQGEVPHPSVPGAGKEKTSFVSRFSQKTTPFRADILGREKKKQIREVERQDVREAQVTKNEPETEKPENDFLVKKKSGVRIDLFSKLSPQEKNREPKTLVQRFFIPEKLRLVSRLAVNLIPRQLFASNTQEERIRRVFHLAYFFIALLFLFGAGWGMLGWYEARNEKELEELALQTQRIDEEMGSLKKDIVRFTDFKKRLDEAEKLLEKYKYRSRLFALLKQYTIDGIEYGTIQSENKGGIEYVTLETSADDYGTLARQMLVFQNAPEFISRVEFSSVGSTEKKDSKFLPVQFRVGLQLQDGVLQGAVKIQK